MRAFAAIVLAAGLVFAAAAKDVTVTVDGKTVVLHDNFTWEYQNQAAAPSAGPALALAKPAKAALVLASQTGPYRLSLNGGVWRQTAQSNDSAEFQFTNKDSSGYGMMIYEGMPIELATLRSALIQNAKAVDPNVQLLSVQAATVNGLAGELVSYRVKSEDTAFVFLSFISSGDNGTFQYTFYTVDKLFDKLKPAFLEAIAGLELAKQ